MKGERGGVLGAMARGVRRLVDGRGLLRRFAVSRGTVRLEIEVKACGRLEEVLAAVQREVLERQPLPTRPEQIQ